MTRSFKLGAIAGLLVLLGTTLASAAGPSRSLSIQRTVVRNAPVVQRVQVQRVQVQQIQRVQQIRVQQVVQPVVVQRVQKVVVAPVQAVAVTHHTAVAAIAVQPLQAFYTAPAVVAPVITAGTDAAQLRTEVETLKLQLELQRLKSEAK